jgi:hypothetical protein
MWRSIGLAAAFLITSNVAFGSGTVTLKGKVSDASGNPVEHAMVMVYHAGVKTGYSTFCPSCYIDCGKRTFTDAAGAYTFTNLNPNLWFELLVVRDGYEPVSIQKVVPSSGPPTIAVLKIRPEVDDPRRVVRGRVMDSHGTPLRDVVVQSKGFQEGLGATYGTVPGLDLLAVTNNSGEFEIAYSKPTSGMLLLVEGRTMSPTFVVLHTGADRQTIELHEGAIVRGRLVADGNPVSDAEVGLIATERGGYGPDLNIIGNPYEEMKVGTQKDGTFAITNVPSPVDWYVYGKMESLAGRGATDLVKCATTGDKKTVDLGDVQVTRGHRLEGRVILSDGKPIPAGMEIVITSKRAWDSQTTSLSSDGRFRFADLSAGAFSITPSVKGYALPDGERDVAVSIKRDVQGWSVILKPVEDVSAQR